jgi:hypothetical protein
VFLAGSTAFKIVCPRWRPTTTASSRPCAPGESLFCCRGYAVAAVPWCAADNLLPASRHAAAFVAADGSHSSHGSHNHISVCLSRCVCSYESRLREYEERLRRYESGGAPPAHHPRLNGPGSIAVRYRRDPLFRHEEVYKTKSFRCQNSGTPLYRGPSAPQCLGPRVEGREGPCIGALCPVGRGLAQAWTLGKRCISREPRLGAWPQSERGVSGCERTNQRATSRVWPGWWTQRLSCWVRTRRRIMGAGRGHRASMITSLR